METEKWGVGNAKDSKAFDTVKLKDKTIELIHGEHPHSRSDQNTYGRTADGKVYGFDGHRRPFKIEIEEYNYLKQSDLSGDEIRKGCSVKVYCDGILCFDGFSRNYEAGYRIAHNFILDMEEHWNWFPKNVEKEIGRVVGYNEQLFKIQSFIISQACILLETLDGKPRKKFLWEDEEDYETESTMKVELTCPNLTWFPSGHNNEK